MWFSRALAGWWLPLTAAAVWAWSQHFAGLYGQDAHDYLARARDWHGWLLGGPRPEPSLHPQAYPFAGAVLGFVVGSEWRALRIISALAFLGVVQLVHAEARRRMTDEQAAASITLLGVAASPFMLRHALFAMSDMLCVFFVMMAYHQALLFRLDGRGKRTLITALSAGAGLATREASAPLFLVIGLHILFSIFKHGAWRAALAGLLGKGALALLVFVLLGRSGRSVWDHPWLLAWSPLNFFRRSFHTIDGFSEHPLPNLVHALFPLAHPGFLLPGLLLLFFLRPADAKDDGVRLAAGAFSAYVLFIAGIPFQNDRFLLLVQPLVVMICLPAFGRSWRAVRHGWWLIVPVMAVLQFVLFIYGLRTFVRAAEEERELASLVRSHRERPLYQFSLGPALATYGVRGPLVDLWSNDVDHFPAGSLLLFNAKAFGAQWKDTRIMGAWEAAEAQRPTLIAERDDGWALYRFDQ